MKTPAVATHPNRSLGSKHYPRAPRLKVEVTAEHIAQAKTRDSGHCMTGYGILAVRPDAFSISIDLQTIRFSDKKKRLRYVYLTPRIVQERIVLWDQGRGVEPFNFTLAGAHVTTMYQRKNVITGVRTPADGSGQVPVEVAVPAKSTHKRNTEAALLSRQGIRLEGGGHVPTRIGGRRPPVSRDKTGVPFNRRRAFGLRALVR